jgi:uncharacterized protein
MDASLKSDHPTENTAQPLSPAPSRPPSQTPSRPAWVDGWQEDYRAVLVESWSPFLGATLIVLVIMALMASGLFWGVFGGLKLWGDYLNTWLGLGALLGISAELDNPLLHRISIMNMVLVLGAFSAAVVSGQFRINRPPPLEYVWGALGGTLMGIGAALAGGCTVGGFFTPVLISSPVGWVMWIGLMAGAAIGVKVMLWALDHIEWGTEAPTPVSMQAVKPYLPWVGLGIAALVAFWAADWFVSPDKKLAARAIIVVAGFALGFILQRSRFCFARVIREPLMTGEGEMTKAMIFAIGLGIPFGALLISLKLADPYSAIPAAFWLGSLLGGLVFGVGMILAGGCASGSLWRMGEGHLKLWVAAFFFAWSGSIASGVLKKFGLSRVDFDIDFLDGTPEITALGYQAFLPDLAGWGWAYGLGIGLLALWYAAVRYNESTDRFTLF